MRLFLNIHEALPEIRRDLAKSPRIQSTRVQNQDLTQNGHAIYMHEAQNYGYTIMPGGIPTTPHEMVTFIQTQFPLYEGIPAQLLIDWMTFQAHERLSPLRTQKTRTCHPSDASHPILCTLQEGQEHSYYYGDRMVGTVETLANTLATNPDSRRGFWPIYSEQDARRSALMTRIPCTLGYQVMIRPVPGMRDQLHLTYLSRSCDLEKFWATDLWFAYKLQEAIRQELQLRYSIDVDLGNTSHFILSLHRFMTEDEELF